MGSEGVLGYLIFVPVAFTALLCFSSILISLSLCHDVIGSAPLPLSLPYLAATNASLWQRWRGTASLEPGIFAAPATFLVPSSLSLL